MRRRPAAEQTDDPGQDSFLDIVANIVGILIILIMVVGVQAKDALVEAAVAGAEDSVTSKAEVHAATTEAVGLQTALRSTATAIGQVEQQIALRADAQSQLNAAVQQLEDKLAAQRSELTAEQQAIFDLRRQKDAAESELAKLDRLKSTVENYEQPPEVLKHLPTPMAKTVFGKEIHYRLLGGRLTRVPMNQFIEIIRNQFKLKIWKLKEASQVTETAGPIDGFNLKYTIRRVDFVAQTSAGPTRRQGVEVAGIVLLPVAANLGEPLEYALREGSVFQQQLAKLNPRQTTITVWTYPDSFDQFRNLKEHLFERGFLSAGRPMPEGYPIGASPDGRRSAAQ
jgi:hypothetical protein